MSERKPRRTPNLPPDFSTRVSEGLKRKRRGGWTNNPLRAEGVSDTRITFNCTKAEKAEWKRYAADFQMTLSEYVRFALMELNDKEDV